jgi:hypothetical protein
VREWLKARGRFVWENLDALLVIVVGLGVAILDVVGNPKPEIVNAAILSLLAVTAIVLLRDRSARGELGDLRQLAGDAISDRPYEVVWQENRWELQDRTKATVKVTERLRFTQNDVSTIADWSQGPGRVERYQARWRRTDEEQWIPAQEIHTFPIRNGEKVIYSLDGEHCRGDTLEWYTERHTVDRFPNAHESVTLEARTKADHPRLMEITWPADAPPSHIEIRFNDQPARTLTPSKKGDQACVEEQISGLLVGQSVTIAWNW